MVKAREDGYGQDLQSSVSATLDRGTHHGAASVHGQNPHPRRGHYRDRALHRFTDIVQLQIEEDLLARPDHFAHEFEACGRVQFHTDLVEVDGMAELSDQIARLRGVVDIQRNDERVVTHKIRMGGPCRVSTRPMRYASG